MTRACFFPDTMKFSNGHRPPRNLCDDTKKVNVYILNLFFPF